MDCLRRKYLDSAVPMVLIVPIVDSWPPQPPHTALVPGPCQPSRVRKDLPRPESDSKLTCPPNRINCNGPFLRDVPVAEPPRPEWSGKRARERQWARRGGPAYGRPPGRTLRSGSIHRAIRERVTQRGVEGVGGEKPCLHPRAGVSMFGPSNRPSNIEEVPK